ncbi:MAG TPA: hypothetical protein VHV78_06775 [Gemmatimonadaceae bacterium]|nr:hypothetical protein [Gemmatimonadaceae bacterium]
MRRLKKSGTLTAAGYDFGPNQGLNLSNVFTSNTYSVALEFQLTDISGYRKILDVADQGSDDGLYDLNGELQFFNETGSTPVSIAANTNIFVVFARDNATNMIAGYVNGVQEFDLTGSGGEADFRGANNIARFFEDDNVTGQREASGGWWTTSPRTTLR